MKPVIAVIVALIVVAGGWYWYTTMGPGAEMVPATNSASVNTPGTTDTNTNPSVGAPTSATVTLTADGFSPSPVTIKKGGTVTFVNEGTGQMWVAAAQHPTHTSYSGTTLTEHCDDAVDGSFDQCKNGTTYSFTFDKTGSWNYHNHSVSGQFGTVIVVEQ